MHSSSDLIIPRTTYDLRALVVVIVLASGLFVQATRLLGSRWPVGRSTGCDPVPSP